MRFAGNIIWFVLGGFLGAIFWGLVGLLFIWTPYGIGFLQIAKLYLFPFGKTVVNMREIDKAKRLIKTSKKLAEQAPLIAEAAVGAGVMTTANMGKGLAITKESFRTIFTILWLPLGIILAILGLIHGMLLFITIIGIPFALQAFKIAEVALNPAGKRVVSKEMANEVRTTIAKAKLGNL